MDPVVEPKAEAVPVTQEGPTTGDSARLPTDEHLETPVAVKDAEAQEPAIQAYPAGFSYSDIKARASMVSSVGDQPAEKSECWGSDTITKIMWILFLLGFVTGITWVVNIFLPIFRKKPRFPTYGSSIAWWASLVMIVVYVILITTLAVVLPRNNHNSCDCFATNGYGGFCTCH